MDIKLRNKRIKLYREILDLYRFQKQANDFIYHNEKNFSTPESLSALKEMKEIILLKEKEYDKKRKEELKIEKKLISTCQHEIIIKDKYNCFCPLCGKLIIDIPDTSVFELTLPNSSDIQKDTFFKTNVYDNVQEYIEQLINNGIESGNILSYVEEPFEELQYNTDVKIRRLKR